MAPTQERALAEWLAPYMELPWNSWGGGGGEAVFCVYLGKLQEQWIGQQAVLWNRII